ncbi:hypothetical protein BGZ98_010353 [Dissophora globulifera]|nr:hypothetical protein BGZ98_010353 [Dissophora globulifera]
MQDLQQRLESSEQQGDHLSSSAASFRIEETIFSKRDYVVLNGDIEELFVDFQRRSTGLGNKAKAKATVDNINSFMYILNAACPDYRPQSSTPSKERLNWSRFCCLRDEEALCDDLDKELKMTGKVASKASANSFEDDILFIYQCLSRKLPEWYLPFQDTNEDTFAHAALDVFF